MLNLVITRFKSIPSELLLEKLTHLKIKNILVFLAKILKNKLLYQLYNKLKFIPSSYE